jgi:hypothetical protein
MHDDMRQLPRKYSLDQVYDLKVSLQDQEEEYELLNE